MSRKKTELNKYELGYLASPLLTADEAVKLADILKGIIEKAKGEITSELTPAVLPLAYKVAKVVNHKRSTFADAYFGAIQAEMSPAAAEAVQIEIKKLDTVLRFMFVVLIKDAEPLSEAKRPAIKTKRNDFPVVDEQLVDEVAPNEETEEKEPEQVDEEELNKKIEDLVSEEA